ncbi:MAG: gluconate 2-dehydrogenase subunit 3 family protein [Pseudomonadota bacterium]
MANTALTRRTALRGLGTGVVWLSYPGLAAALDKKAVGEAGAGLLFNQAEMRVLTMLVDTVLPETETPGGVALGVPAFIDTQLPACHSEAEQSTARDVLSAVATASRERYGKPAEQLSDSERVAVLSTLDSGKKPFSTSQMWAFRALKRLMAFGYFTTETGATEILTYQAVPGGFKGSIPYASVGTSWGSLAYY